MAEATVIEVHLPGEVAAAMRMRDRSGTDEERVRVPLALGLFAQGTISLAKAAALAAMTRSLALALAPAIRVNGLALGAILPPPEAEGKMEEPPAGSLLPRWGSVEEAVDALLFLLAGSDFITGEILHLDGGRHIS